MYSFENIFICRDFRVIGDAVDAFGLGIVHPASIDRLFVFGQLLAPMRMGEVKYRLEIEQTDSLGSGLVHRGLFRRLRKPNTGAPRLILDTFVVRDVLVPGNYQAIIEVEETVRGSIGFRVE